MGLVDILYWKMAAACCVTGIFFLFVTTEGLVRGRFRIPAWVFSSFTLVIGVFFFRVFLNSLAEFSVGRHDSIDELIAAWKLVGGFLSLIS